MQSHAGVNLLLNLASAESDSESGWHTTLLDGGDETALRWLDYAVSSDPRTAELPTGLVTFMMTDIVGSTELFRTLGAASYGALLGTHRELIRDAIATNQGVEVGTEGDSFLAAFSTADAAVHAAVDAQQALSRADWPGAANVRVRMGVHLGHATLGNERQYVAFAIHQAARVTAAARGGQILATQTVADVIGRPTELRIEPVGSFWLKDFPEPVPLVAIDPAGTTEVPAVPQAPRADLSNLPALRGPFLGRDAELTELAGLLADPVLLTITGPGGVGKTRLALEVAAERAANGSEAWIVELAGVTAREAGAEPGSSATDSVSAVVAAIARTIGSPARTPADLARQLSASPMIMVIDNAEHLLDAVAEVVDVLMSGCPQLRLVVTSRSPLAVTDETLHRLAPLTIPQAGSEPEVIDGSPAVQLFTARAIAADRSFELTVSNRDHVVGLCRMLDGLPLALELAAARINILPPEALLERVRSVGDLPGLTGRGRPNRHATLHTVLDWSLSLCTDAEVAVLRRMAAFAGPADLAAITTVCGGDLLTSADVVDALVGLVDKSLVTSRRTDTATYDLLVTVRQAALSRLLAADERDEALWRHTSWVLNRVRAAAPSGLERDGTAIQSIALEIEVALERGLAGEIPGPAYIELFLALRDHFFFRQQRLGIRHGQHIGAESRDPATKAHCANIVAKAKLEIREPDFEAVTQEALAIARASGDAEALGRSLLAVAEIDLLKGPHLSDTALVALAESMTLMEQVSAASPRSELHLLVARGWAALNAGDFAIAADWYAECLEASRRHGSAFIEAASHFNLAEAAELAGNSARAVEEYRRAAATSLRLDGFVSAADAFMQAAGLLITSGAPADAVDCAADAVLAARRARSDELLRTALLVQVDAAEAAGDRHGAQRVRSEVEAVAARLQVGAARAI